MKDWIQDLYIKEYIIPKKKVKDYYTEDGKVVFTKEYHLKRGYCCGNKCRNCGYVPKHIKNNKNIK